MLIKANKKEKKTLAFVIDRLLNHLKNIEKTSLVQEFQQRKKNKKKHRVNQGEETKIEIKERKRKIKRRDIPKRLNAVHGGVQRTITSGYEHILYNITPCIIYT